MKNEDSIKGTQALDRAIAVMRRIAAQNGTGVTAGEISSALDLSYPTTHRLLQALVRNGLIAQSGTKAYRLGELLFELGLQARSPIGSLGLYRPILEQTAERTSSSAYLMMLHDGEVVCLASCIGGGSVRTTTIGDGDRRPMCDSVAGIAMIAAMDPHEALAAIKDARLLPAISTRLSDIALTAQVEDCRRNGIAYWDGVVIAGIAGAAAAIPAQRKPRLALAISSLSALLPNTAIPELRGILQDQARQIAAIRDAITR